MYDKIIVPDVYVFIRSGHLPSMSIKEAQIPGQLAKADFIPLETRAVRNFIWEADCN